MKKVQLDKLNDNNNECVVYFDEKAVKVWLKEPVSGGDLSFCAEGLIQDAEYVSVEYRLYGCLLKQCWYDTSSWEEDYISRPHEGLKRICIMNRNMLVEFIY